MTLAVEDACSILAPRSKQNKDLGDWDFFFIVIDLSLEREKNYKAGENLIFDTEKGKTNWCKNMRMKLLQKC